MAPARTPLLLALFATALPAAAAAKDANTIVYAAFGDWGWPLQGASRGGGGAEWRVPCGGGTW
jgi:hypothetical protein